jgi:hypothetical protein
MGYVGNVALTSFPEPSPELVRHLEEALGLGELLRTPTNNSYHVIGRTLPTLERIRRSTPLACVPVDPQSVAYGLAAGDPTKVPTLTYGPPTSKQRLPLLVNMLIGGLVTIWA